MALDFELPPTMRALIIDETGAPDVLHLADRPLPRQISDEVLVKVVAAGLNPIDAKTRSGKGVSAAIESYPAILGNDFSGVVVRGAFEASPLQPGDAVYGMGRVPRTGGCFAEYVSVSSMSIARKPARRPARERPDRQLAVHGSGCRGRQQSRGQDCPAREQK
jgi:NADPH:quinone reductase-like Zn-dependent oxidoreductase